MSDVRTIMERGVGDAGPPPDGYERMLRRRERKQRRQRVVAGVVGIAFFAAAIWVVSTEHSSDRTQAPASVSSDLPPATGLFGLPPEGATLSTPALGELVLGFVFSHGEGDPGRFSTHLYADGRLISEQLGDYTTGLPATGLVERRLTPEGVNLLKAAVTSAAVFDHSAHLVGYLAGLSPGELDIRDGIRLVRITWGTPEQGDLPDEAATNAQVNALKQIDAQLENPTSWLPASAWASADPQGFVPSRYSVCYATQPIATVARVLDSFPQRAADLLRTWDRTRDVIEHPQPYASVVTWCSNVTTEQARSLNSIFEDAHFERPMPPYLRYLSELGGAGAHEAWIDIAPLLPDQV